jgi:hypothetical protein
MMSEEEMVLGSSGTCLEGPRSGTKHEGIQAASGRHAYQHRAVRLLRRFIRNVLVHYGCSGLECWPCLDQATSTHVADSKASILRTRQLQGHIQDLNSLGRQPIPLAFALTFTITMHTSL